MDKEEAESIFLESWKRIYKNIYDIYIEEKGIRGYQNKNKLRTDLLDMLRSKSLDKKVYISINMFGTFIINLLLIYAPEEDKHLCFELVDDGKKFFIRESIKRERREIGKKNIKGTFKYIIFRLRQWGVEIEDEKQSPTLVEIVEQIKVKLSKLISKGKLNR